MYDPKLNGTDDETYSVSEDTLDEYDLTALLEIALEHTEAKRAWGTFSFADIHTYMGADSNSQYGPQMGFSFELEQLLPDMLTPAENYCTPEFWWPEDRSWLVWTDRDLNGTKVFGSAAMIAKIRASEVLETIDWHP
ncbi:hypothetical protein UM93_04205 [Psychromicrobium lacuslunae]|uniref:Uncharacterized protein n=2 Tax=Psychromicrobium lacuslunae TaxID=1618207 RepID=A0A0D4BXQ5_9MICC|nr:hypothetical protein UM93_04205 [Psychromicrobium lacuslunae]